MFDVLDSLFLDSVGSKQVGHSDQTGPKGTRPSPGIIKIRFKSTSAKIRVNTSVECVK